MATTPSNCSKHEETCADSGNVAELANKQGKIMPMKMIVLEGSA